MPGAPAHSEHSLRVAAPEAGAPQRALPGLSTPGGR